MIQVGKAAGEYLYLSWSDSVKTAMERYEVIIEKHKCGDYTQRRRLSETMLRANGRLMAGLGNLEYHIKKHN